MTTPPRAHLPRGTYVSVIRHEHGWEDGRIAGYLIDDYGTVEIVEDDGTRYTVECLKRRDYVEATPPAPKSEKARRREERVAALIKRVMSRAPRVPSPRARGDADRDDPGPYLCNPCAQTLAVGAAGTQLATVDRQVIVSHAHRPRDPVGRLAAPRGVPDLKVARPVPLLPWPPALKHRLSLETLTLLQGTP